MSANPNQDSSSTRQLQRKLCVSIRGTLNIATFLTRAGGPGLEKFESCVDQYVP
jgi:hypothetical protein